MLYLLSLQVDNIYQHLLLSYCFPTMLKDPHMYLRVLQLFFRVFVYRVCFTIAIIAGNTNIAYAKKPLPVFPL